MSHKTQASQYAKKMQHIIAEITQLYEIYGKTLKNEKRTYIEHAIISAAVAESSHLAETFVIAALLHDIGHLILIGQGEADDNVTAQSIGARWLHDRGWPDLLTDTIENYLQAARYIVFFDEHFLSLKAIPMTESEARQFEQDPNFNHYVDLVLTDYLASRSNFTVDRIPDLWNNYAKKMLQYLTLFYEKRHTHTLFKTPLSPIAEVNESK